MKMILKSWDLVGVIYLESPDRKGNVKASVVKQISGFKRRALHRSARDRE